MLCPTLWSLDVNECEQFQVDCGHDRACFNTHGAYECVDIPCPTGYIRQNRTDCLLKCSSHYAPSCSHRRAIHIQHRFIAIPRFTVSNQTIFRFHPIADQHKSSTVLVDTSSTGSPFPFLLDGDNLRVNRSLANSNEYELEIHQYKNEFYGKHLSHHRRRLHTIVHMRINVSPFDF